MLALPMARLGRTAAVVVALLGSVACAPLPTKTMKGAPTAALASADSPHSDRPPVPSNPRATPQARAVLAYLASLTSGERPGVLVGQNCGHGSELPRAYEEYVGRLRQQSGRTVAVVGVDYEFLRPFERDELHDANAVLIEHWKRGGLVTINATPQCPFALDGDVFNAQGNDLAQVLVPGTRANRQWMRMLDRWAAALAELRDAGVVVLWRPMQEMNGTHPHAFWYSSRYNPPDAFVAVWRHMHRYFVETKKLDNLLWVYSQIGGGCQAGTNPGADTVDVLAGTAYGDELRLWGYDQCVELYQQQGKPLGWAEMGHDFNTAFGDFDLRGYVDQLATRYPGVAYFVAWHDWDASQMALVDNRHATELMRDPRIITAEQVRWRDYLPR